MLSQSMTPRFALWLQDTEFTAMLEEADVAAWIWRCSIGWLVFWNVLSKL